MFHLHPGMTVPSVQQFTALCHELNVPEVTLDADTFFDLLALSRKSGWRIKMDGAGTERTRLFRVQGISFRKTHRK